MPKILQCFSGNIGFHHIHHLSPRIPNYDPQRCHEAEPQFLQVKPMTLFQSESLTVRLRDERGKRLVGYGRVRQQKDARKARHQPPKRS